jgi:phosphate transport system substrate-binding protein
VAFFGVVSCGGGTGDGTTDPLIRIDGSSTVYPITEAVAEEFQNKNQNVRITVGVSGTGGGFQKFCNGETDISDASRPISKTEVEACAKNGVAFIELPIAYDGIAIVVNPKNTWVDHITPAELKALWGPEAQGKVTRWSQVRKGWPDREVHLFGAGVDSGTFDYFTEAISGKAKASRGDFTSSEDDNVLVQGVSTDELALGYFGYTYFEENKDKLKLVPVDDGNDDNAKGPILPSPETIRNGTYQPLSRPLFIYVSVKSLERPEVKAFVEYYLKEGPWLMDQVGAVQLGDKAYELVRQRLAKRATGTVFQGAAIGLTIDQLLAREQ